MTSPLVIRRASPRGLGVRGGGGGGTPGPPGEDGPQGPPGPGTGAGAWQPATAYTSNQVVQAPDGAMIKAVDSHTSSGTYGPDQHVHWRQLLARHTYVTPEEFGAVGNGTANDTTALQAAIDFVAALGGGEVVCSRRYGWNGDLTVKNNVHLVGHATRQAPFDDDPADTVGLVALSGSARLRIGDWTTATHPGGVRNLYVDGNNVGGLGEELVRIAGVDLRIDNLFAHRSAGDGIVYDATQNSTITGCFSTYHDGVALVLDNGAGALAFHGGYYGTSKGGSLVLRNTPGEGDAYPFGPGQNNWYGTIFEAYPDLDFDTSYAAHVHLRTGLNNSFWGCNFTAGSENDTHCAVLVDSTENAITTTAAFHDGFWFVGPLNDDAIRVVNAEVLINGLHHVGDDGDVHAESFLCIDTNIPSVSMPGAKVLIWPYTDATRVIRTINGGSLLGVFGYQDAGTQFRLRLTQVVGWQRETDGDPRGFIDRDFAHSWYDPVGDPGIPKAILDLDASGTGLRHAGGPFNMEDGSRIAGARDNDLPDWQFPAAAITLDASLNNFYRLGWTATTATTITISNPVDGRELSILLAPAGTVTLTWPADVEWGPGGPPVLTSGEFQTVHLVYDDTFEVWVETARSGDAAGGGGGGAVDSVNGETGTVVLDKADIGLGNVDNTSDLDKPVSTATQTELDDKEPLLPADGTAADYLTGEKTWVTLPTYSVPTQAEAEAGTATTARVWTAQRIKQAIDALAGGTDPTAPNVQTANYTLAIGDAEGVVEINSATGKTVTVPTNATVAFPIGTRIEVSQYGIGQVTIAWAGGVTVHPASSFTTRAQYSSVVLRKRAADEWVLGGDAT